MITLTDVKTAIISLIKPIGPKIYGSEIKQGFDRPCFFVQLMPISSDIITTNFSDNSITIEIVYFSLNETDLENVQMYDILRSIFLIPIQIGSRKKLAQKIRSETEEYVMSFKFDINYFDEIPNNEPVQPIAGKVQINLTGE